MADGFAVSEQPLEKVMPGSDLDVNVTGDLYKQHLATLHRFFWPWLSSEQTEIAAAYGASKFQFFFETPDEPRHLTFKLKMRIAGGGTSAEAKLRLNGDAGTDLERSTTSTTDVTITWDFDIAVVGAYPDQSLVCDLFLKTTGGGTTHVNDMGYPASFWAQAA